MPKAYVNGKPIALDPTKVKGKGGEADIFEIAPGLVAKMFKQPNHADLKGDPKGQKDARERIKTHQTKLKAFPAGLPSNVSHPIDLVMDEPTGGTIIGYTMAFLPGDVIFHFGDKTLRQRNNITNEDVQKVFRHLHETVSQVHNRQCILGDFNDLGVLVEGLKVSIIDSDSMQFGPFYCRTFTDKFVDPTLCAPSLDSPVLCKPHTTESDWYAFAIMLMQSLLYVGPYGGVYKPKDHTKRIPHSKRPLQRITVFHPEVQYPKPALPLKMLPDDLNHHFTQVFVRDQRQGFDRRLIDNMRWTNCTKCGAYHARNQCPECKTQASAAVKTTIQRRGKVSDERIFKTSGTILYASFQGQLRWLYHENGQFRRGDVSTFALPKAMGPNVRYRLRGEDTLMGLGGVMLKLDPGMQIARTSVDAYRTIPVFDANAKHRYWVSGGQLKRDDHSFGTESEFYIGDVLAEQTLIWVGDNFGFGFYRAGELSQAFVFDAEKRGINDAVKLNGFKGKLLDAICVFSGNRCWFFAITQQGGKTIHTVWLINHLGAVEAQAEAVAGDSSWLGMEIRGKCAMGPYLFAATDDGIIRLEAQGGTVIQTQSYPDTEPFVESSNQLFPGPGGIYVLSDKEIHLIKMA